MGNRLESGLRVVVGEEVPIGAKFQAADVVISVSGDLKTQRNGNRVGTTTLADLPVLKTNPDGSVYYSTGGSKPRVAVLREEIVVQYTQKLPY